MSSLKDGFFHLFKIDDDGEIGESRGIILVKDGQISILEDPNKQIENLIEEGPADAKAARSIATVNRNHYMRFVYDNDPDLYKEFKVDQDVEKSDKVCLPKKDFVSEHEDLLDVLAHPTKKKLKAEIKEQSEELKDVKGVKKQEDLSKPYASDAQRRWAHTESGKEALGGEKAVAHWDKESKGKDLPEKVSKSLMKADGDRYPDVAHTPEALRNSDDPGRDLRELSRYPNRNEISKDQIDAVIDAHHKGSEKLGENFYDLPTVDSSHIDKILDHGFKEAKDGNPSPLHNALYHGAHTSKFDKNHINRVLDSYDQDMSGESHRKIHTMLRRNPNVDESIINKVLDSDHAGRSENAIQNPNATEANIDKALTKDRETANYAAYHDNATPNNLINAIKSEKHHLVRPVLKSNKVNSDVLHAVIDKEGGDMSNETAGKIANHPEADDTHLDKLSKLKHLDEGILQTARGTPIEFPMNSGKIRQARDMASKNPDKMVHIRDLKEVGIDPGDQKIMHLKEKNDKFHADKLQSHIDSLPKMKFNYTHDTYGREPEGLEEGDRDSAFDVHMENFDPDDHIDRSDYYDHDAQVQEHMGNFDPKDWDVEKDEDGEYDKHGVEEAEKHHMENFDPSDYDHLIDNKKYDRALEDAHERHANDFQYDDSNTKEKAYADASDTSDQRHTYEPSEVFQLNVTPDHIKQMKAAGVHDEFNRMMQESRNSNHPVTPKSVGWARYTQGEDGTHIDEIQSDFGQSFVKQGKAQIKQAASPEGFTGPDGNTVRITPEEAAHHTASLEGKFSDAGHGKISKILFGDKHPNEVIHEALLQHLRDNGHVGKEVQIWSPESKAPISGMTTKNRKLPGHMLATYGDQPKKMGYKPSKYGSLETQHNPSFQGNPTMSQKLSKKESSYNSLMKIAGIDFISMLRRDGGHKGSDKGLGHDPSTGKPYRLHSGDDSESI